jgi:hypothetical protein
MEPNELFAPETEIKATYRDVETYHHLRNPTPEEWFHYRRQTSSFQVRKKTARATDESVGAPLGLYDRICERVEIQNGAGRQSVEDFKTKIPIQLKEAVIVRFLNEVEIGEAEDLGNS